MQNDYICKAIPSAIIPLFGNNIHGPQNQKDLYLLYGGLMKIMFLAY